MLLGSVACSVVRLWWCLVVLVSHCRAGAARLAGWSPLGTAATVASFCWTELLPSNIQDPVLEDADSGSRCRTN